LVQGSAVLLALATAGLAGELLGLGSLEALLGGGGGGLVVEEVTAAAGETGAVAAGAERAGAALSKEEAAGLRDLFGKSINGAQELLGRLRAGESVPLPSGVTQQTLEKYRTIAENAIQTGKDTLGVQAARQEAIDALLKGRGP
jgi:hypothetical protein